MPRDLLFLLTLDMLDWIILAGLYKAPIFVHFTGSKDSETETHYMPSLLRRLKIKVLLLGTADSEKYLVQGRQQQT